MDVTVGNAPFGLLRQVLAHGSTLGFPLLLAPESRPRIRHPIEVQPLNLRLGGEEYVRGPFFREPFHALLRLHYVSDGDEAVGAGALYLVEVHAELRGLA